MLLILKYLLSAEMEQNAAFGIVVLKNFKFFSFISRKYSKMYFI